MKKTALLAILLPLLANGEELEKEITIEREIVPELRAATRLNIYPSLQRPDLRPVELSFRDFAQWSALTPMLSPYEPAYTGAAVEQSPWRGYVKGVYATEKNGELEAAYRAVSTGRTLLDFGIEGRYTDYKRRSDLFDEKVAVKRAEAGARAGFSHRFDGGKLSLDTRFLFSRVNHPEELLDPSRNAVDWRFGAKWEGESEGKGLRYGFRGDYRLFNFGRAAAEDLQPMRQHGFSLGGNALQEIDSHSSAGVDISGSFLNFNHFGEIEDKGKTQGYIALRPHWVFDNGTVTARVGVRADFSFNAGKKVHVAPDILAGYNPESWLGIALRLGGGEHLNPLAELYREAPCFSPYVSYGMSHIPFEGELKFRVGPFRGFAVEVGAAYAAANNWLMPLYERELPVWGAFDLRSVKAGARLSWQYRSIVGLAVGFEAVCGEGPRGDWYQWRDRSRQRLGAEVSVKPVEKLEIKLGYSRRMDRAMACFDGAEVYYANLRDYDNLEAEISYEVLKPLRVFVGGENLLDNRSMEPFGIPDQGIRGRVGLLFRF